MEALKERYYTYDEWLSWDENVRVELYDGILVMLAQPSQKHQKVLMELAAQLHAYLKGKQCEVYPAPFGVRLSENEDTAFEPDIVVVCDKSKLGGKAYVGAPDMIIEILSPSTARIDRGIKFRKYLKAGVREYWIVDPELKLLQVNILSGKNYIISIYDSDEVAPVQILDGCEINLADVFRDD